MTEYWNVKSCVHFFCSLDALAITADIVDSIVEKYENVQTTINFEGARDDAFSDDAFRFQYIRLGSFCRRGAPRAQQLDWK